MHSDSSLCKALCTSFVIRVGRKFQWISVESFNGFQKHLKCEQRGFKTSMPYMGTKGSVSAVSKEYLGKKTYLKRDLSYREASEIHSSHNILL